MSPVVLLETPFDGKRGGVLLDNFLSINKDNFVLIFYTSSCIQVIRNNSITDGDCPMTVYGVLLQKAISLADECLLKIFRL